MSSASSSRCNWTADEADSLSAVLSAAIARSMRSALARTPSAWCCQRCCASAGRSRSTIFRSPCRSRSSSSNRRAWVSASTAFRCVRSKPLESLRDLFAVRNASVSLPRPSLYSPMAEPCAAAFVKRGCEPTDRSARDWAIAALASLPRSKASTTLLRGSGSLALGSRGAADSVAATTRAATKAAIEIDLR